MDMPGIKAVSNACDGNRFLTWSALFATALRPLNPASSSAQTMELESELSSHDSADAPGNWRPQ